LTADRLFPEGVQQASGRHGAGNRQPAASNAQSEREGENRMKSICPYMSMLAVIAGLLIVESAPAKEPATKEKRQAAKSTPAAEKAAPKIQLAILLDTSGSMNGLINQARTQLWKIVNELATAKQNGRTPDLEVALYEYGKSSIPKDEGYLRQIVALTDDLDAISEQLFALTTGGGQEYCGQVIQAATSGLVWSKADDDLKLIFIAGNEAFTQGTVSYKAACSTAISKGITVNTIFCGPEAEGIRTGWRDGAVLADGSFLHIDQNRRVAAIKTPFDQKLAELSGKVNRTFVFFGDKANRQYLARRQVAQDKAAAKAAPSAAAERASFKSKKQYKSKADLVEAVISGKVKLKDIKDEELPESLRKLSLVEKKAYIKGKDKERAAIQSEISKLSKQRTKYIAEQKRKQSESTPKNTLDAAIIKAIRTQAKKKKFAFDGE
jgi:hypothetical protein